jgi:hypothetical protein
MSFIRYVPQVLIPFNERAYTYVFEDYFSTTVPAWAIQSGSGGSILQSGAVTNDTNIGMIGLYTGTTTTGRMALISHVDGIQFGNNEWTFETRANIQNLSDATNTYTVRFGFMDASTGDPTDGHFFRYTHGTNSGKWQAVTRVNGVETASDTGETATAMTNGSPMPRWAIIVDNSGTSVTFKINDRIVVTRSVSGFTGSSRLTGIAYSMIKSAGTTTRALFIDYTLIACKLGTHR